MKSENRIISYLIMLVIYWFSTSFLISLDEILKIDKVFITLGFGFALINIAYSFLILKWTTLLNIFCSILIASLSLFLALEIGNLGLFPSFDPYGILTSIITNALLSIIFWETTYQIKTKINTNKKDE
ncbi:hypothetical protein [Flavobacterium sp. LC2016-12]|uniref:hypothetical protein n=1 Tax=Flavobacterium sp. LC2016-12 TaxID=2783794 RepID=UPI00188A3D69|nr:hypothetical protein [Flavobacterium sp. LC2016-12]MBF4466178.1 hypothetical protein [Flavobacterium sp. LC2016-12]